ncbi:hypothetical protein GCM10020255_033910 [Rhodococcus baikonurensis]
MSSVLETSYFPADVSDPIAEQTVGGLLRECAADSPNLTAIREVVPAQSHSLSGAAETDRTWTFGELLAEAEGCAHYLLSQFDRGDRITVWAPNVPEWMILQYGAALAGMVLVTANPALGAEELAYVLSQSQSRGLFHTGKFRGGDMAAVASEAISISERKFSQSTSRIGIVRFEVGRANGAYCPKSLLTTMRRSSTRRGPPARPRGHCCTTEVWSTTPISSVGEANSPNAVRWFRPCRCSTPPGAASWFSARHSEECPSA